MNNNFQRFPIGVRYVLLSAFGFALTGMFVKLLSGGIPILEIVAARALVSLVLSAWDLRRRRIAFWGQQKLWLLARGAIGTIGLICVFYSFSTLPLAEATVLQYLHPMFTAIIAVFFLKERLKPHVIVCVLLSFLGVIFIVRPSFFFGATASNYDIFAIWVAVAGAFFSAVAYNLVKKLNQTEDALVIIFYFPLVALPVSLMLLGDDFVLPTLEQTFLLVCVGLGTQMGQLGLTKAMQTETAGRATSLSYIQVVFSIAFGWLVFNQWPDVWVFAGITLIFIGLIINLFPKWKLIPYKN